MAKRQTLSPTILLLLLLGLAAWAQLSAAYLPYQEAMRLCRLRTGLKEGDIKQHHARNQK